MIDQAPYIPTFDPTARLASILAGKFVAHGVAIDDEARDLMNSIEQFAEDQGTPIRIAMIDNTQNHGAVVDAAERSDFVLVDHRLQGKFIGYEDGLEVAQTVRTKNQARPIFYCSAYPQDFQQQKSGRVTFVDRMNFLVRSPHTFFYPKRDLNVEGRLKEFTQAVYWQSFGFTLHNLLRSGEIESLNAWLSMRQVQKEARLYKILGPAARGWTRVREIAERRATTEEIVPSRLLKRAGIKRTRGNVEHVLIEFDGGQVFSFFRPRDFGKSMISPRVLEILNSGETEDE
jgi:CheY-like chemotaxis protein